MTEIPIPIYNGMSRRFQQAQFQSEISSSNITPPSIPALHSYTLKVTLPSVVTVASDAASYSHIESLPVELLGEIFFHCVENDKDCVEINNEEGFSSPQRRLAPMLLCRVNSHWRTVALSISALWSSINPEQYGSRSTHTDLVKLWLERSCPSPLSLRLGLPIVEHTSASHIKTSNQILAMALEHLCRWRNITLYLDGTLARQFVTINGRAVPSVESIEIDNSADDSSKELADEVLAVVCSFPNLRRLTWRLESGPIIQKPIPWVQLTYLNIQLPMSMEDVTHCLSQCISAETVKFISVRWTGGQLKALHQTVLPRLQSFYLCVTKDHSKLLDAFTMPQLRFMRLGVTDSLYPNRKASSIEELLLRSSPPLEQLKLVEYFGSNEDDVVAYLKIPFLQSVPDVSIDSEFPFDRIRGIFEAASDDTSKAIRGHLQKLRKRVIGWRSGIKLHF